MIERFNGRIADVLRTHRFDSTASLQTTLKRFVYLYNHHIPQKGLHLNLASSLRHGVTTHSGRSWRGNLFTRCRCGTRQLAETVTTSPSLDP